MPSAPADSRDDAQEQVEVEERRDSVAITFVSPDSFPANDPVYAGTFPLTNREGEWFI